MWYHLILLLVIYQELLYLYFYYVQIIICTDELISAPKTITIFPTLPFVNENSERESNPISQLLYLYLSTIAFLVSFTAPNKQLPSVKSVFKSFYDGSSLNVIYKSTVFLRRKETLFCFKHIPLNFKSYIPIK